MKPNFNLKRIRREVPNPSNSLRLHRGEFGHNYLQKVNHDRYYADTEALIKEIKKNLKLSKNQNIVLGQGAESLIKDFIYWHSINNKRNKRILIYEPNYFMYEYFAKLNGYKIFKFSLNVDENYYINENEILKYLKNYKIKLLVLVNPSAPIEKKIKEKSLIKILEYCKKKNIFIILDEVYADFYSKSSLNLLKKFDKLIIIRTFSKTAGYPGLKVGFSISGEKIFKAMNSLRLSVEHSSYVINKCIKLLKSNSIKNNQKIIKNTIYWGRKNFLKINIDSLTRTIIWFTIDLKQKKLKKKVIDKFKAKNIFVYHKFNKDFDTLISFTASHLNNFKYIFNLIKSVNTKLK